MAEVIASYRAYCCVRIAPSPSQEVVDGSAVLGANRSYWLMKQFSSDVTQSIKNFGRAVRAVLRGHITIVAPRAARRARYRPCHARQEYREPLLLDERGIAGAADGQPHAVLLR